MLQSGAPVGNNNDNDNDNNSGNANNADKNAADAASQQLFCVRYRALSSIKSPLFNGYQTELEVELAKICLSIDDTAIVGLSFLMSDLSEQMLDVSDLTVRHKARSEPPPRAAAAAAAADPRAVLASDKAKAALQRKRVGAGAKGKGMRSRSNSLTQMLQATRMPTAAGTQQQQLKKKKAALRGSHISALSARFV